MISFYFYFVLKVNFIKLCNLVGNILKNLQFIFLVGALTSKPFAFKAWSWELTTSYIVNTTDSLSDKVWVDLKGLDVVWILPWLYNKNTEGWISDKIRFSYDGFSLNWVSRFYLWKNILFIPIISSLYYFNNKLLQKYFSFFQKKTKILKKISLFKNSKQNIFEYYFSIFFFLNFFSSLFSKYIYINKKTTNFNFIQNNFLYKSINLKWIRTKAWRKFNFYSILWIKNYFFKLQNYTKIPKNQFFIKNFISLSSMSFKILFFTIYFYIFNNKNFKNYNVFTNEQSDLIYANYTNYFSNCFYKNYKNTFLNLIEHKKFRDFIKNFYYYNFFIENDSLSNIDFFLLFGTNLRINAPRLHLILRRIAKNNNILILTYANNDFILMNTINLGFCKYIFLNILKGMHWVNKFFTNSKKCNFIFGKDFLKLKLSNDFIQNLKLRNKFFVDILFYKKYINKKFIIWKKLYYLTHYFVINFLMETAYDYSNVFFNLHSFNGRIKFFLYEWIKKSKKKYNINFFFDLNTFNIFNNLLLTYFNIKSNYNILYVSAINDIYLNRQIDFIMPITNLIENFNVYKTYQGFINKSLFLKLGPWLTKNVLIYFSIFLKLKIYPYLWLVQLNKVKIFVIYLIIQLWLQGTSKIFFLKKKKKLSKLLIKKKFWFANYDKNLNYMVLLKKTNFWFSKVEFLNSSKYCTLGFNLSNKIAKTYQML